MLMQSTAFQNSSEPEDATGCFQLGVCYSTGKGVPFDLVTAHKWFNVATLQGNKEAAGWRAELALEMTPAQIAEAQRLAREWFLSHPHLCRH